MLPLLLQSICQWNYLPTNPDRFKLDDVRQRLGRISDRRRQQSSETPPYLEYVADQRLVALGIQPLYHAKNPFSFMELQAVQELTNFFERRVTAYQVGVSGEESFTEEF